MKKICINNHEYELHTPILTMHERDDEDMPLLTIYTAIDRSQGETPWLALVENSEGEYSECGVGGDKTEKELAVSIYYSFSGMTSADFVESELFD